jgi:hypothetical protein
LFPPPICASMKFRYRKPRFSDVAFYGSGRPTRYDWRSWELRGKYGVSLAVEYSPIGHACPITQSELHIAKSDSRIIRHACQDILHKIYHDQSQLRPRPSRDQPTTQ